MIEQVARQTIEAEGQAVLSRLRQIRDTLRATLPETGSAGGCGPLCRESRGAEPGVSGGRGGLSMARVPLGFAALSLRAATLAERSDAPLHRLRQPGPACGRGCILTRGHLAIRHNNPRTRHSTTCTCLYSRRYRPWVPHRYPPGACPYRSQCRPRHRYRHR